MPQQTLNHARLNIVEAGAGPETQVLLHGLLFSHRMFDAQVDALQSRFRCVRMDFRAQGESEVTRSGYDLDTLADDAIALIESLGGAPMHLLGFSMGGMVAQLLALKRPENCRLSQNCASMPKYRPRRNAVSAETDRLPWVISLIRR